MPSKKEESHDCKAECAELHQQLGALRKEIAALKKELAKKPAGGADPRVDKIISYLTSVWGEESVKAGLK